MSVRMRHTSSHSKNRRSHHALAERVVLKDKETGALSLPHRLDETTGMYRGKLIVPQKAPKAKKESLLSKIKLPATKDAEAEEKTEDQEAKAKVAVAKKAAASKTKVPAGVKKHDKD